MPHSFTSIHIHYVFSPHSRSHLDSPDMRKHLQNYIDGICHNLDCDCLASYVMPDHIHLLLRISPKISVVEIAQKIKANSSRHMNTMPDRKCRFAWQEGYGAFSCSYSMLDVVREYISNQEEHHKVHDFEDEFRSLVKKHELDQGSMR